MKTFSQKESLADKIVTPNRHLLQGNTPSGNGQLPNIGSPLLLLLLFILLLPGARLGGLGWKWAPTNGRSSNQCSKDLPARGTIAKSHLDLEPLDLLSFSFFLIFL